MQTGPLFPAVGAEGGGVSVTVTVPADPVHPFVVAVTEYVPTLEVVTPVMTGFCDVDEKLFGPLHAYVVPVELAVSETSLPGQTGELLPATGAAGEALIVTVADPDPPAAHPGTVTETEYVPAAAVLTPAMLGFCTASVKPLGPFQE